MSLSSVVQQASQGFKNSVQGAQNEVKQGVNGAIQNAKNDVINAGRGAIENVTRPVAQAVTSGVRQATQSAVNGALGAATSLIKGDTSGAAKALGGAFSGVQQAISSTFGIVSGTVLSGGGLFGGSAKGSAQGAAEFGNPFAGAQSRADPVTNINWYAVLPTITANNNQASLPWYYVEKATVPMREFQSRSIYRNGRDKHYPGKYSVESLRLTFYADSANKALRYIMAWGNAPLESFEAENALAQGGRFNLPKSYFGEIQIYLLTPDKKDMALLRYTGCWPTNIDALNLGSEGVERIVYEVTFNVGDVFVELMGVGSTEQSGILGPVIAKAKDEIYSAQSFPVTSPQTTVTQIA